MTIPPHRLQAALFAMLKIQLRPGHFSEHRQLAWDSLETLRPDLALLPAQEAWDKVKQESLEFEEA